MKIKIRLDKSFFNLGRTKPETLSLQYTGDGPGATTHTLRLCAQDGGPSEGIPCMSEPPKILPNSHPIKDLRGDLEFNVNALGNGRYAQ